MRMEMKKKGKDERRERKEEKINDRKLEQGRR